MNRRGGDDNDEASFVVLEDLCFPRRTALRAATRLSGSVPDPWLCVIASRRFCPWRGRVFGRLRSNHDAEFGGAREVPELLIFQLGRETRHVPNRRSAREGCQLMNSPQRAPCMC